MVDVESKVFSCLFMLDVLCSHVKSEKSKGVMDRCLKCRHYLRFLRIMHDEDMKVMDEIDEIRRTGVYK
jgi:hypothetical protein